MKISRELFNQRLCKDNLYQLYVVEKKPMYQIANLLEVSTGTVYNFIKRYGIKSRKIGEARIGTHISEEHKKIISKAHKGKKLSKETREKMAQSKRINGSGHTKKRKDGYIAVYYPMHPKSNKDGYIMQHHLVMEKHIGRYIKDDEVVHHINGIKDDNRIENLKLMTFREHAGLHMKERWKKKKGDDDLSMQ